MDNITAFTFDDILLVPRYSDVEREDIDIRSYFHWYCLSVPVMSSPMDTITEKEMMYAMYEAGGLGFHHRYTLPIEDLRKVQPCPGGMAISPSMGIDFVLSLFYDDAYPFVVLDVAHGHSKKNLDFCEELIKNRCVVISGNVATPQAVEDYLNIGVHDFRVGIGGGSVCSTRVVTGVGVPQGAAIYEIRKEFPDHDEVKIISDGGHHNTGHIVKALALGADYVMLGGMLAGCDEVPEKKTEDGKIIYRGMASADALSERKKEFFTEGVTREVKPKGSVSVVLKEIKDAIEQACYYLGAKNLRELESCYKMLITQNAFIEGKPKE